MNVGLRRLVKEKDLSSLCSEKLSKQMPNSIAVRVLASSLSPTAFPGFSFTLCLCSFIRISSLVPLLVLLTQCYLDGSHMVYSSSVGSSNKERRNLIESVLQHTPINAKSSGLPMVRFLRSTVRRGFEPRRAVSNVLCRGDKQTRQ